MSRSTARPTMPACARRSPPSCASRPRPASTSSATASSASCAPGRSMCWIAWRHRGARRRCAARRRARPDAVSGILRRVFPDAEIAQARHRGRGRADHLQGPRRGCARYRDLQGRRWRRRAPRSKARSCPWWRPPARCRAARTNTTRATRSSCSRSPTRCARNTRRSSTPGSVRAGGRRVPALHVRRRLRGPGSGGLPQMGRGAHRRAQPRARGPARGEGALSHLLGQL